MGVDSGRLDEVDDADDVEAAVIELIMEVEQLAGPAEARLTSLRGEPEALKPRALKQRAPGVGADPRKLDGADDANRC